MKNNNEAGPSGRRGAPICTATGRLFWPLDPRPEEVAIEDVAAALSKLCRFGGHCRAFYSIAQHSIHVAELVEAEGQGPVAVLRALLHDAAEAYLLDLPRPIKYASGMQPYRNAEADVESVIVAAFNLPLLAPSIILWADQTIFATEVRDLMPNCRSEFWSTTNPPRSERIVPWTPERAEASFLAAFERLATAAAEQNTCE